MATFHSFTEDLLRHGEPDDLIEEVAIGDSSVPEKDPNDKPRPEKTS